MTSTTTQSAKERRNEQTARNVLKWTNNQNTEMFLSSLAEDYVWKADALLPHPGAFTGLEEVKRAFVHMFRVFPDIQQKEVFTVAAGDRVFQVTVIEGSRTNGFMGLPEINEPYRYNTMAVYTFNEAGKIKETWMFWDEALVLKQQGQIPFVSVFSRVPIPNLHMPPTESLFDSSRQQAGRWSNCPAPTDLSNLTQELLRFPFRVMLWSARTILKQGETAYGRRSHEQ